MSFYDLVYENVKRIPKGRVATYGQIAMMCGSPRASRVVGSALHKNPTPVIVPCHRVVNRFGGLAADFAFGGKDKQKELLESEGVSVDHEYKVDMEKYLWRL